MCQASAGGIWSERTRCHREAVGAVLCNRDRRTGSYYGVAYACAEHLDECVRRELSSELTTSEIIVTRANRLTKS